MSSRTDSIAVRRRETRALRGRSGRSSDNTGRFGSAQSAIARSTTKAELRGAGCPRRQAGKAPSRSTQRLRLCCKDTSTTPTGRARGTRGKSFLTVGRSRFLSRPRASHNRPGGPSAEAGESPPTGRRTCRPGALAFLRAPVRAVDRELHVERELQGPSSTDFPLFPPAPGRDAP